jgi:hypothetical protein
MDGLNWDTFHEGFRNAHISTGIMNLKKDEFRTLRQGGRTMKEYMDDVYSLSRFLWRTLIQTPRGRTNSSVA